MQSDVVVESRDYGRISYVRMYKNVAERMYKTIALVHVENQVLNKCPTAILV